jgi:hypothetical protein
MDILQVTTFSIYTSTTVISLFLTLLVRSYLSSEDFTRIRGRGIRVKYSFTILTMLVLLSFVPVLNVIVSIRLINKLLIEEK